MRCLALFLLACVSLSGAGTPGELAGLIQDRSGAALGSVTVTAMDQETGIRRTAQTNGEGVYQIPAVETGLYKVSVRRPGFQSIVRWDVQIGQGPGTRLDFVMQVGSMRQVITVEGAPAVMNTEDGSVGMVSGRGNIEALPISGRGVLALVELAPGVVATPATSGEAGQFTTNGLRANTNYFTVDGVSANGGVTGGGLPAQFAGLSLPAMTAFGSTGNLSSNDALEEVRVLTSSFAPQFGRLPGAQVALTTRSGSNEFHGSASYRLRNETLDAGDWFSNANGTERTRLRLNQWNVTAGGPLRRDRTFVFAAYEGLRLQQPYTRTVATPSADARRNAPPDFQALLNAFPVPDGPTQLVGVGRSVEQFSRTSRLDSASLRIDHALTERVNLFGRYHRAPSYTESGFDPIEHFHLRSSSLTLGMSAMLPNGWTNDLRTNVWNNTAAAEWSQNPATGARPLDFASLLKAQAPQSAAFYAVTIGGVGALYSGNSGQNHQGAWNLVDTLAVDRRRHALRFGLDYERVTPARDNPADSITGTWSSLSDVLAGKPAVVVTSHAEQASALIETVSAFAQDTWSPLSRLTLTYGVRWELTPAPAIREPAAVYTGVAAPTAPVGFSGPQTLSYLPLAADTQALWRMNYRQLAPRVGGAFRLSDRSAIRAGWGVFYDIGFSTALDPINGFPFNRWQFSTVGAAAAPSDAPALGSRVAPDLQLPYAMEWNVAYERLIGFRNVLSASYVGSSGHRLLRYEGILEPASRLAQFVVATNHGTSNYHGLELQYRRRLSGGFQGTLSYTWSHSMDNGSWDSGWYLADPSLPAANDRASSSFDVRHNFNAGIIYLSHRGGNGTFARLTGHWQASGILRMRTGFPIDVMTHDNLLGLGFDDIGRPDLNAGVPLWLPSGTLGGRRLNPAAFSVPSGLQGNLGRNAISGAGMWQMDLALKREFSWEGGPAVEFALGAYNALNHPNAADPVRFMDSPFFGSPVSMLNLMLGNGSPRSGLTPAFQIGGPRSLEMSLHVRF